MSTVTVMASSLVDDLERLGQTALRIKQQRDDLVAFVATLKHSDCDIEHGVDYRCDLCKRIDEAITKAS